MTELPKDAAEWLQKWDAGDVVPSVSMGGLGDGYEQAIQELAVELLRHLTTSKAKWWGGDDDKAAWKAVRESMDPIIESMDKSHGFSGAQVGAAVNLATILHRRGISAMGDEAVKDRLITIRRPLR